MSKQGAERAVVISALVVFGMYFYRVITEGQSKQQGGVAQLLGIGAPANIGRFVTGWGFAYLVLAILAEASPPFGGSLAILVAAGDFLTNGSDLFQQLTGQLSKPYKPSAAFTGSTGTGLSNVGATVAGGVNASNPPAAHPPRRVPPLGGIGHRNTP